MFLRVVVEEGTGAEHGFSAVGTFVHEECAVFYRCLELRIKLHVDASDFFCVEVFTTVIAPHSANIANNAKIYSIAQSSIQRFCEEKLTPILKTLRWLSAKRRA